MKLIFFQDEVKEQELLVRLERGDYEELKTKETEFIKIKDENQLLKTKIKKLQNSALERLVQFPVLTCDFLSPTITFLKWPILIVGDLVTVNKWAIKLKWPILISAWELSIINLLARSDLA